MPGRYALKSHGVDMKKMLNDGRATALILEGEQRVDIGLTCDR
jgi:hypothetical protein